MRHSMMMSNAQLIFICMSLLVVYASGFALLSKSSSLLLAKPPIITASKTTSLNSEASYEPIRLNKVFKKTHSRRQADQLIADGRITVNGKPSHSAGQRVMPFEDVVRLDGNVIEGWEEMNHLQNPNSNQSGPKGKGVAAGDSLRRTFEYIKYWKPLGVTCTTDRRIENNLIDALKEDGCHPKTRIFPVGRLDKETSGLLIMTSDGQLPNAALRGRFKQPKTYLVRTNRPVHPKDVQQLREGVVITTVAQRDGNRGKPLTAPTLPCPIRQSTKNPRVLEITLVEGRNRQIRKMLEAVGYRVTDLHRKTFLQMNLDNLEGPGDWAHLSRNEMQIIEEVLSQAEEGKDDP